MAAILALFAVCALGCEGSNSSADSGVSPLDTSSNNEPDLGPEPACDDGVKNGRETDVDCGGLHCEPCENDQVCRAHADCVSGQCFGGTCRGTSCESRGCPDAHTCYQGICYETCSADGDCEMPEACTDSACVDACALVDCQSDQACYRGECYGTCSNQSQCGDSSRCFAGGCVPIDCGGVECRSDEACYHGACLAACADETDCTITGAICEEGACVVPSCADGLNNGRETGVDCGGPDCPTCSGGQLCDADADCTSGDCDSGTCLSTGCDDNACESNSGWYDDGASVDCCDGDRACSTCQDQEYRTFACDGDDCAYEVTDNQTVRDDCRDCPTGEVCDQGICPSDNCTCAGTATECGCTMCTDCSADDGWYDDGATYGCCDVDQTCTCQDQEYRTHTCDGDVCSFSVTDTRTDIGGCQDCPTGEACDQGSCSSVSCTCSGADNDCGCTTCIDCTAADGWYDDGATYDCCDIDQTCTCQDQEYRTHTCDGDACTYSVTDQRTEHSGCTSCDDANECTTNSCNAGSCTTTNLADGDPCTGGECCSGACTDTSTDPDHCGDCGVVCDPGTPTCSAGVCE